MEENAVFAKRNAFACDVDRFTTGGQSRIGASIPMLIQRES